MCVFAQKWTMNDYKQSSSRVKNTFQRSETISKSYSLFSELVFFHLTKAKSASGY